MATTKLISNPGEYLMAKLAEELILVAEKDSTMFSPVLCRLCPEAGMITSMQLPKFYGKKLKPFLAGVTCLSDEVKSVLPAADLLDQKLTRMYFSACSEDKLRSPCNKDLDHYQIGEVCKPILLDWLNGQHVHIMEWTELAFNLEKLSMALLKGAELISFANLATSSFFKGVAHSLSFTCKRFCATVLMRARIAASESYGSCIPATSERALIIFQSSLASPTVGTAGSFLLNAEAGRITLARTPSHMHTCVFEHHEFLKLFALSYPQI